MELHTQSKRPFFGTVKPQHIILIFSVFCGLLQPNAKVKRAAGDGASGSFCMVRYKIIALPRLLHLYTLATAYAPMSAPRRQVGQQGWLDNLRWLHRLIFGRCRRLHRWLYRRHQILNEAINGRFWLYRWHWLGYVDDYGLLGLPWHKWRRARKRHQNQSKQHHET